MAFFAKAVVITLWLEPCVAVQGGQFVTLADVSHTGSSTDVHDITKTSTPRPGQECWGKANCRSEGAAPCGWCGGEDWFCCNVKKAYPDADNCRNVKYSSNTKGHRCAQLQGDSPMPTPPPPQTPPPPTPTIAATPPPSPRPSSGSKCAWKRYAKKGWAQVDSSSGYHISGAKKHYKKADRTKKFTCQSGNKNAWCWESQGELQDPPAGVAQLKNMVAYEWVCGGSLLEKGRWVNLSALGKATVTVEANGELSIDQGGA